MGVSRLRSHRLRIALIASAVLVVLAIPVSATDHLVAGEHAVVSGTSGSGVNVRTEPSTSSDVHFIADDGTVVQVISGPYESEGASWYNVQVNGQDAWVMSDFLQESSSAAGGRVQVVNTNGFGLRLREGPSSQTDTLTVLSEGSTLNVVGAEQTDETGVTWANVSYNGTTGYAHRGYLAVAGSGEQSATPEEPADPNPPEPVEPVGDEGQSDQHDAVHQEPEPEPEPAPEPAPEPEPEPAPEPTNPDGVHVGGNAQVVNTDGYGLNVRHGAGYGHSVVTVAAEGDVLQVLDGPEVDGEGSNWWKVDYRGLSGWVHGGYLQATDAEPTGAGSGSGQSNPDDQNGNGSEAPTVSPTGERIASEAMKYLGYPYVWGGTTPSGFDCSGFLYYVVNQVTGGGFPRGMEAQVNRGTYVPSDQLQPGDLVFQQNTYQWGLSHAGIYIGNGQFIHAATPGSGVVISNLWDSYWGPRYYTARRIQ